MPIICIGPVCVPISAVWPLVVLLFKWIWDKYLSVTGQLPAATEGGQLVLPADAEPIKVDYVKDMDQWEMLKKEGGPVVLDFTVRAKTGTKSKYPWSQCKTWCGGSRSLPALSMAANDP